MNIDKYGFELEKREYIEEELINENENITPLWNRKHVNQNNNYKAGTEDFFDFLRRKENINFYVSEQTPHKIMNEILKIEKKIYTKIKNMLKKYPKLDVEKFGLWKADTTEDTQHLPTIWDKTIYCAHINWDYINYRELSDGVNTFQNIHNDIKKILDEEVPKSIRIDNKDIELTYELDDEYIMIKTVQPIIVDNKKAGTESYDEGIEGIKETINKQWDSIKTAIGETCRLFSDKFLSLLSSSEVLKAEDYEFIKTKQMKKIGDKILSEIKKIYTEFDILPVNEKTISLDVYSYASYKYDDFLKLFNTSSDIKSFSYPLCILKATQDLEKNDLKEKYEMINKIVSDLSPKGFVLIMYDISEKETIVLYSSPKYKNKNQVITGSGESYNLFDFSNKLEDYNLFKQNKFGFGLESNIIDFDHVYQDCKEMYQSCESNLIPIDMDMDTYMQYMGGTEGIIDFFARGWAKFRRVLHPIIKSDIKLSQEDFNILKSKFQTQIQKALPHFEHKLKENRFLKFLIENKGLTINKNVDNAFNNDSRLVSAILVTINSSKIKFKDEVCISVNSKKMDIMDLRNDDKFFTAGSPEDVVYYALNDLIKAINKTIYAEIKKDSSLNKLGLVAALLNDGSFLEVSRKGRTYVYTDDKVGVKDDVFFEEKNTILQQLQNKNLLIGLRSRPIVITSAQPVAVTESCDNFEGGNIMKVRDFSTQINQLDSQVGKLKENTMYVKGTESDVSEKNINQPETTTTEILHRVLDEYGVEGLNKILNPDKK